MVFWPGHEALAETALRVARSRRPLPGLPAAAMLPAGTVILAPSPAAFDSITGGRVPEWGAAVAFPASRTIVFPTYNLGRSGPRAAEATLRHELAHLAVARYLPDPVPRWFHEGYATWVSGEWDEDAAWKLRAGFLLGRAPPLDSLTLSWPREAGAARLAYLLSATAVQHLAARGGEEGFAALLRAWREHGGLDPAIRHTYAMTLGQFEEEWRALVKRRYGWVLALAEMTVVWVLVAVLLLVALGPRRRRNRERMAALEAEERMLPPPSPDGVDDYPWPE